MFVQAQSDGSVVPVFTSDIGKRGGRESERLEAP
jgi:hypothetical protein